MHSDDAPTPQTDAQKFMGAMAVIEQAWQRAVENALDARGEADSGAALANAVLMIDDLRFHLDLLDLHDEAVTPRIRAFDPYRLLAPVGSGDTEIERMQAERDAQGRATAVPTLPDIRRESTPFPVRRTAG